MHFSTSKQKKQNKQSADEKDRLREEMTESERMFLTNPDLLRYRAKTSGTFYEQFSVAFENYVSGDWGKTKEALEECLKMYPDDGPSKSLKKVLARHNDKAPEGWEGNRQLTSK